MILEKFENGVIFNGSKTEVQGERSDEEFDLSQGNGVYGEQ